MEEKYVDYLDGRIFYTDQGHGQVIVLIHGYLESSKVWGRFGESLAKNYRIISIDLPGNGKSSLYDENHTMCFHADAILAVMDIENISKALILGHSLGGYVCLSFVENHPDRLFGYILIHSHPYADTDEIIENRLREIKVVRSGKREAIYPVNIPKMFADINLETFADDIDNLKRIAAEHSDDGIVAVIKGMIQRKSRSDILQKSKVPLLYILGAMDNYIPYDFITSRIIMPEEGKFITLEKSGHMGFLEECDLVVNEVKKFTSTL